MIKLCLIFFSSCYFRRMDHTPLQDAIENDHHEVIKLLVKCGAHLTGSNRYLGEQLCLAASRGSITRLKSYQLAGAPMVQTDSCERTALHVVMTKMTQICYGWIITCRILF